MTKEDFPPVLIYDSDGNKALSEVPQGYELVTDKDTIVGRRWLWSYAGAPHGYLPVIGYGEPQRPGNIYCKPEGT